MKPVKGFSYQIIDQWVHIYEYVINTVGGLRIYLQNLRCFDSSSFGILNPNLGDLLIHCSIWFHNYSEKNLPKNNDNHQNPILNN